MRRVRLPSRIRAGFTLVEALVSITIAAMASSALYLGLMSSLQTTQHALEQTIAGGIAEQLMDEAMGTLYMTGGNPYQAVLGPDAWEAAGTHRERYNDIDDFNGVVAAPPKDPYGIALGSDNGTGGLRHANFRAATNLIANWRTEVDVYYVNESSPMTKVTAPPYSGLRAVEVRVYAVETATRKRLITTLRRVHGYVPPPP